MSQTSTKDGTQATAFGLKGNYILKKPDVSQRFSNPMALLQTEASPNLDSSQTLSRAQETPSLRPPRSTGGRVGRSGAVHLTTGPWTTNAARGWNGVVMTEEESGGYGWKSSDLNVGSQPRSGGVERWRPLHRKSESNPQPFPRAEGSVDASNIESPVTVAEYMQSTGMSGSFTAQDACAGVGLTPRTSYGASPRVAQYGSDDQGEKTEYSESDYSRATMRVTSNELPVGVAYGDRVWPQSRGDILQVSVLNAVDCSTQIFAKGDDLVETEASKIEERDGAALPQPHVSPPASAAASEEEALSVVTNATIKPRRRTERSRSTAVKAAPPRDVGGTPNRGDASREPDTVADDRNSGSDDFDHATLTGVSQLEYVGVWDEDLAEVFNSPQGHYRRRENSANGADDAVSDSEHDDAEEPRRVQRVKKRRVKASTKNRDAHASKTKSKKTRNKNATSATPDVGTSNIVPLTTRLSGLCQAVAEVTTTAKPSARKPSPPKSHSSRALDVMYRDAEAEITAPVRQTDAKRERPASRETSLRRAAESISELPKPDSRATRTATPERTRASSRASEDGYSATSPLRIVVVDEMTPGSPLKHSRLPKPENSKKIRQPGRPQVNLKKASQQSAAFMDVTNLKNKANVTRAAPSVEPDNRHQENAKPAPRRPASTSKIPSAPFKGDQSNGPPPALEWSTDGVDVASWKLALLALFVALCVWSAVRYWTPMLGFEDEIVAIDALFSAAPKDSCASYSPLLFCGAEEPSEVDGVSCPTLLEKAFSHHRCLRVLHQPAHETQTAQEEIDPTRTGLGVSWAFAGLAALFVTLWAATRPHAASGDRDDTPAPADRDAVQVRAAQDAPATFDRPFHPPSPRRRAASRPRTPVNTTEPRRPTIARHDHPGAAARLIRTDADLQVYNVDHLSDAESIPESIQTMASATSTNTMRQTRAAARRAALQR